MLVFVYSCLVFSCLHLFNESLHVIMADSLNFQRSKFSLLVFICAVLLVVQNNVYSQETDFKRTSIRTGVGVGLNEGKRETGLGLLYSIGWQKSYGEKNKFRLNPNIIIGGFKPVGITDTREQFYRITSLGLNAHYDLIKYKAFSIVATGGAFVNYSRGLLGTGGMPMHGETITIDSEYFNSFYLGGSVSVALRIDSKNSKLAYELRPLNFQFGNDYFMLGYYMFGIDIKINK